MLKRKNLLMIEFSYTNIYAEIDVTRVLDWLCL